jgi:hypothetical protein
MVRKLGLVAAALGVLAVASAAAASPFNEDEGKKELMAARLRATECSKISGVTGSGKIKVTIGNTGIVTEVLMLSVPPTMDAKTDECVRAEFQKVRVTPFEGQMVIVTGGYVLM